MLDPADYEQLASITRQLPGVEKGVTYTRFVRKDIIQVYGEGSEFQIGKGVVLHESENDVATIITSGIMVDEALKAYEALQAEGINVRVVDMFTWKPLDTELVIKCAKETGAIVTAENHQLIGGLTSAVCEVLAENGVGVAMETIGIRDEFGEVGDQNYLMERFQLTAPYITEAVRKAVAKKA